MAAPNEAVIIFVYSVIADGTMDDQIIELLELEAGASGFLADLIRLFYNDCERKFAEIQYLLDQPVVDYERVRFINVSLKGSSKCMGAIRILQGCEYMTECYAQFDRLGCLEALEEIKNEFYYVKVVFDILLLLLYNGGI